MDLAGGFGDPAPSHPAQAVASFPGSEDFLDPAADPVDRLVPGFELCQRFLFVAAPHAGCDNAWNAPSRADGIPEVAATIGAVGKHLARAVGQRVRASPAIVDIGRGNRNRFDQCGIGIGSDMRLEAVNSGLPLCLTQRASPSSSLAEAIIVASTSVPVLTVIALALSCVVTVANSRRSSP